MLPLTSLLSPHTLLLMATFMTAQIPAMTGRTVVVTGANSGIGRAAARALAAEGARVVLAVRDPTKGRAAAATMTGDVGVRRLDLADLASVRAFAEDVTETIDVLINNAGLMIPPLGRTADGFELQFGTNHLGHFALTNLLLPRIWGRVVTVSSNGHRAGTLDFEDLNWERRPYRAFPAYAQSKLANLLFTAELHRRLTEAGSPVLATAAHPGMAATNLLGHLENDRSLRHRFRTAVISRLSQSNDGGALPTLYAAVADVPGGSYAGPGGFLQGRGAPKLVSRSGAAQDGTLARRLWTVSEELTGVTFPLTATKAAKSNPGHDR
jgi:NAD(P)-dependent dehydrogenase (short-subunit alcohol dehydrogenase family)